MVTRSKPLGHEIKPKIYKKKKKEESERGDRSDYLLRNSSSTTAEMSRRGFPIPKRMPSYAIPELRRGRSREREREREIGGSETERERGGEREEGGGRDTVLGLGIYRV